MMKTQPHKSDYVLLTAADQRFALQALNLIGSTLANSDIFERIYVYDIGMTTGQRQLFADIPGVELRSVPPFVKHWNICWSWKPWIWSNSPAAKTLYLDAGVEVLASLQPALDHIDQHGYFVVSQYEALPGGHPLKDIIPADYYEKFGLGHTNDNDPVVAGGLVGFIRGNSFYDQVITGTLELVTQGYNLGWSEGELGRNKPPHYQPNTPVRDCRYFRHDQTLFNLLLYKYAHKPAIASFDTFAATDRRHRPDQILWNSRRLSPLSHLTNIPYTHRSSVRHLQLVLRRWSLKLTTVYYGKVLKQALKKILITT